MNSTVSILLLLPAAALFLLPGWALTRRIGSGNGAITCFIGSAAILFNVVLLLDALKIPLRTGTVGVALCAVALAILRLPRRVETPASPTSATRSPVTRSAWIWFIPPAIALASVAVRAVIDPLSGYDNVFRWDYLARLVLSQQSLAGYPPVTPADYEAYAWCDGIPPLVPLLNFWIYSATGSTAASMTAIRVIAEAVLLGIAVYRYAELLWGKHAGQCALAVLSSSALALWSVAMGQETGISALAVVVMLYFLELHARDPLDRHVIWAALAGGVAAISRDFNAIVPVLGVALVVARSRRLRPVLFFAGVAGITSVPWYVRNWVITGNPMFPQSFGGMFPGIPIFEELQRNVHQYWSLATSPINPGIIPKILLVLAGPTIVLGVAGFATGRRRMGSLVTATTLTALLWLYVLNYADGGWTYANRVLLPTLALLATAGGWIVTTRRWLRIILLFTLIATSADAARRSWLLPLSALDRAWPYSLSAWRRSREALDQTYSNRVWQILVRVAGNGAIVVDHPAYHRIVSTHGGHAVPLFSPVLRQSFASGPAFDDVRAQLVRDNIRFLVISGGSHTGERLVTAHSFWRELRERYRPNSVVGPLLIYDLQRLEPSGK